MMKNASLYSFFQWIKFKWIYKKLSFLLKTFHSNFFRRHFKMFSLKIVLFYSLISISPALDCSRFVPSNYDRLSSPSKNMFIDFDYKLINIDSVDVQKYVSIASLYRYIRYIIDNSNISAKQSIFSSHSHRVSLSYYLGTIPDYTPTQS